MPFPDGPPILGRIAEALRKVELIDQIIIATSRNEENDPIEVFAKKRNISIFRGDENDVQSRFFDLTQTYNFDHVIRLTGDNPMIDPKYLTEAIRYHIDSDCDYTKTQGLPLGSNFEVIKSACLLDRIGKIRTNAEKEHVTYFIANTDLIKKNIIEFNLPNMDVRFTVDYPQDYAMVSLLCHLTKSSFDLDQITLELAQHNWMKEINLGMTQKKID